ncbi:MAG: alpha/beta fold hydrolase [Gammaproteobacteria bacterium]|nr:alpha/beta fold hydrolase [Gammaproteobacteria bacterium]MBQ0838914.1 alpha/beta fold hydrolase [Gammaproteobacteria bacterium]
MSQTLPETKPYRTNFWGRSGHLQTIFPALFRRVSGPGWQRERITTGDGDFIDLDWHSRGGSRLLILCHGLEGSSDTHYIKGMAQACVSEGWDVLAYNFRGCSGEPNLIASSYHSGSTDDLAAVVKHSIASQRYRQVAMAGFSLGANQVLKYLGEDRDDRPAELCAGIGISPPCDLSTCSDQLEQRQNRLYQARFLRSLQAKVRLKAALIEAQLGPVEPRPCRSIREFDERFVAPLNGFTSAEDYYQRSSCLPMLAQIAIPTLLLSALDDPLLSPACFPSAQSIANPMLSLEYSQHGGHVGFIQRHPLGWYWAEQRTVTFLQAIVAGHV